MVLVFRSRTLNASALNTRTAMSTTKGSCDNSRLVVDFLFIMTKIKDLTGQRIGRLLVLKKDDTPHKRPYWICKCDCGNIISVSGGHLKENTQNKSCGCYKHERFETHGKSKTRIYRIYKGIIQRCYNSKYDKNKKYYIDKKIKICDAWRNDFMAFYNWAMKNGYSDNLTIDRIDGNGNYCPENCRWVDVKTQSQNRSNVYKIYYKGQTYTLTDFSNKVSLSRSTIRKKIKAGYKIEDILQYYRRNI